MIKLENTKVIGWEHAIRGMRNPMNSWDKSDSDWEDWNLNDSEKVDIPVEEAFENWKYFVGPNDLGLMQKLSLGGSVHAKYRRMIVVYVDITAPLYWWKEFDTYKVGTVANSCSTMHKIHAKEFTLDDFSHEHLISDQVLPASRLTALGLLDGIIYELNGCRAMYLDTKDKKWWWQMIQLLPSSYNQKRTVMLNYEVLAGIYPMRRDHKLDEWRIFCEWIESLPLAKNIVY